jgi:hypothetical protein
MLAPVTTRKWRSANRTNVSIRSLEDDFLRGAASSPVVKTFDNIESTAQGKIELSFIPVVNYPMVKAIEVVPEPQ